LQTSYYGSKAAKLPEAVAISQGIPKYYRGKVYKKLAPPWSLVKEKDQEVFTELYKKQVLSKLQPAQVYAELGPSAILLCWEKPGVFCHRRVVAEWLEKHLGIRIPEWKEPEKTPAVEQISLLNLI